MYRLRNIYGLDTLEKWLKAFECGLVTLKKGKIDEISKQQLLRIVKMGMQNCLPIQIVCYRQSCGSTNQCIVYSDSYLEFLLDFLKGRSALAAGDEEICFDKMGNEERNRLLKASINSVWIQIED